jgi:peptide/nickel transport system permease protein
MFRFIVQRLLLSIPLLLFISMILFILMNTLGDPLTIFAESRQRPSPAAREELRRRLGLDQPIFNQYITWLIGNDWQVVDVRGDGSLMEPGTRRGFLRGDLGVSFITRQPAGTRITERLPNTLVLMLPSFTITILLALLIGIYSATHPYSFFDNAVTAISLFFFSMPIFFIALMCIYIFGLQFKQWGLPSLPIGGMFEPGDRSFGQLLIHMIMPTFCLVSISLAGYVRFIRSSVMEVLGQDYVRTAHAKGLVERKVINRHVLKNASLPLVTLIGLDLPFLLGGAVVTETIFAWPGMGRLFVEALERSDFNVMMAILMLISVGVVASQIITDVVYTWFDPRIRFN